MVNSPDLMNISRNVKGPGAIDAAICLTAIFIPPGVFADVRFLFLFLFILSPGYSYSLAFRFSESAMAS